MINNTTQILTSFGTNCKDAALELIQLPISKIYEYIKISNTGLIEQTKLLRTVLKYDQNRYRTMKTSLPYFGCSTFLPSHRKLTNFEKAYGMILDIDWKTSLDRDTLTRIQDDPRVVLSYISPSAAGAKIVFMFDEPMEDSYKYSQVYKSFAHQFARDYNINNVLDFRNSDASRISFLCYDPEAIYNSNAIPIVWSDYYDESHFLEVKPKENKHEIPPDIYRTILKKLKSQPKRVTTKRIVQSITKHIPNIHKILKEYDIQVKEEIPIAYGVKIRVQLSEDEGEINIYHGKKGYSIVISPRKTTNDKLNELTKHLITSILF